MKINQIILILTVILLLPLTAISQQLAQQYNSRQKSAFTENKGQVTDQDGKVRNDVKYFFTAQGLKLVMKSNSFSYEIFKAKKKNDELIFSEASSPLSSISFPNIFKEPEEETIFNHRIDVSFIGANPKPEIIAEDKSTDFNNYYLSRISEVSVREVYSYNKITYKNLYPNIDIVWYAREEGKLKYDIVVHPGGKLEDVKMKYDGALGLILKEGRLELITSQGKIEEEIPTSFLAENQHKILIMYSINNNIVSFKGNYNIHKTLVIDPTLRWGTYYGGSWNDWGISINTDKNGYIYVTGMTESSSGIATTGAYQTTLYPCCGRFDAYVVKFKSNGIRQWGTYYGGNSTTLGYSVCTDNGNNVYITGWTASTSGFTTSGAHQTSSGGWYEAYIVKLNSTGGRQWSTYYGGNGSDYGHDIIADKGGNIYITGASHSTSGFSTSGAHQTTNGGNWDAFVAKFNSNGVRQWGTFYGGSDDDYSYGLSTDDSSNIYFTGYTKSTSNIATSGAHQTSNAGGWDAFAAKLNSSGVRQWGTYFGGSKDENGWSSICTDKNYNVYIIGSTTSSAGIADSNSHQTFYGGGTNDVYIAKFNKKGVKQWSTYYGGSDNDFGYGITTDGKTKIYITGYTYSTTGIATSGAYQDTFGGGSFNSNGGGDAFITKFNDNGVRQWGTYYGGSDNDQGLDITAFGSSNVYMTGITLSDSNIATKGAHLASPAGNEDAFIVNFCDITATLSDSQNTCSGALKIYFANKDTGLNYLWSVTGGTIISGQGTDSIAVKWGNAGTGTLKVIVSSSPCKDSISRKITINPLPLSKTGTNSTICSGTQITIGANAVNGNTYYWSSNPPGFTSATANPLINPKTTTTYYLTEINTTTGCTKTDSVTITVNPLPKANFFARNICLGDVLDFTDSSQSAIKRIWYFGDGDTSTLNNPIHIYKDTGNYIVSQVVYSVHGCKDSISKKIRVNSLPEANTGSSRNICLGDSTSIGSVAVSGNSYSWTSIPTGFTSSLAKVKVSPVVTTTFYLTETILTSGCKKTDSIKITVNPLPNATTGKAKSICYGENIIIGSSGVNGNLYNWTSKPTGFTSILSNPMVSPSATTIYYLTETNITTGCNKTDSVTITINPLPIADFISTKECLGRTTAFTNVSKNASSFIWNFGDGDSSFINTPTHLYKTAGTYQVKLIVTSNSGCKDSVTKAVIVDSLPIADFTTSNTCLGDSTNFRNSSTGSVTNLWSFGDGNLSTVENPSHVYSSPGKYNIKLKVWNGAGCIDSITKSITIYPLPVATFSGTQDTTVKRAYIFSSKENASQYLWSFGDGKIDSGKIVKHIYQNDSIYKITLTIIDTNGCTDNADTTIKILTLGFKELLAPVFDLKLYPNPFTNTSNLEYNLEGKTKTVISVYDLAGKEIAVLQNGTQQEGKHIITIDAERYQLKAGIYILKILIGDQIISRQLVKLKE